MGNCFNTLAVVGTAWGDEGKGKFTDFYASNSDIVVRSQGGNNAGHTIVVDGEKIALRTLPSGVVDKNRHIVNVIAAGCVVNPVQMVSELKSVVQYRHGDVPTVYLSKYAHVITVFHKLMDAHIEDVRRYKVKTTGNGIGPCYASKMFRVGLRVEDLTLSYDEIWAKLRELVSVFGLVVTEDEIAAETKSLMEAYEYLEENVKIIDESPYLTECIEQGMRVLFEGAQGALLDIDRGDYPYVTSSSPTAASIPQNCGIAPRYINEVCGVVKAYATRVGTGAFDTEIDDEVAVYIRERGHEYGTVTGRPRRIGWLDLCAIEKAVRINGITHIVLTLLDVLTGLENIKIHYYDKELGKVVDKWFVGWHTDIRECKTYEELPFEARHYIEFIENKLGVPIKYISVGPDREQTIEKPKSSNF